MSNDAKKDFSSIFDLTNVNQGNIKYNYKTEKIAFDRFFIEYFNLDKRVKSGTFISIKDKLITCNTQLKGILDFSIKKEIKKKYTKFVLTDKRKESHFYVKKLGLFNEEYLINYFVAPELEDFYKKYKLLQELLEFSNDVSSNNLWWIDLTGDKCQKRMDSNFYRSIGIDDEFNTNTCLKYKKMIDAAGKINQEYAKAVESEQQAFDNCVKGFRDSYKCKYPILTPNNEVLWVDTFAKIVSRDKHNRPLLLIGVDILISEELDIGHKAETLKKVIDEGVNNSGIGVWWMVFDKNKKVFEFNDKLRELYGYSDTLIHKSDDVEFDDKYWMNKKSKVINAYPEYKRFFLEDERKFKKITSGDISQYRSILPLFNDKEVINWIEVRANVISTDKFGNPNIVSGTAIDITELYESQSMNEISDRLKRIHNAYKSAIEMADLLIWTVDYDEFPNGDYVYGSENFNNKLGLKKDEKGVVIIDDFLSTIVTDDNSEVLNVSDIRKLLNDCQNEVIDGFDGVLFKHINPETNKIMYMKHYTKVHSRKLDGSIRNISGYLVDVTNEYIEKERVEELTLSNSKVQAFNQLAITAGRLMVFNIQYESIIEDSNIYVNDLFVDTLGLDVSKNSSITFRDYKKTMLDDKEGIELYRINNKTYLEALKGNGNIIRKTITKHINKKTGKVVYLEHYAQVEERDSNGLVIKLGGFLRDVTTEILNEYKIKYLAENDVLTDLYNRNSFEQHSKDLGDAPYSIIIGDIDGLKLNNDIYGHLIGDEILVTFAKFLKEIYSGDQIYRIGGDEFAVISSITDESILEEKNKSLHECVGKHNEKKLQNFAVSIGYETVNGGDFQSAFTVAENRMYQKKLSNRSSRKSKTLETLLATLNENTEETREHCERIAKLSQKVLTKMGYSRTNELSDIAVAAKVHDIGKITISEEILSKPDKLTYEEYEKIKKHSEAGYKIIINIDTSNKIAESVLYHHERHDGLGYPFGLKGDEIPLYAKILSVCDAYDTMVFGRKYREALSEEDALKEIIWCKGTQFDPKVADKLIEVVHENLSKIIDNSL